MSVFTSTSLPEHLQFTRANWRACMRGAGWLSIPFLLALVADGYTTWRIFQFDGGDGELHPAIRLLAMWTGPLGGAVLGKAAQLLELVVLAGVLPERGFRLVMLLATVFYAAAACLNHHSYVQLVG